MVNVQEMVRYARSRQLQNLYDRIAAGRCTRCNRPNEGGTKWLCPECRDYAKPYMNEYNRVRRQK